VIIPVDCVTNHINVISSKNISIQNTKIKPISLNEDLYFIFKIDGLSTLSPMNSRTGGCPPPDTTTIFPRRPRRHWMDTRLGRWRSGLGR
jgi:hypothetical protein